MRVGDGRTSTQALQRNSDERTAKGRLHHLHGALDIAYREVMVDDLSSRHSGDLIQPFDLPVNFSGVRDCTKHSTNIGKNLKDYANLNTSETIA